MIRPDCVEWYATARPAPTLLMLPVRPCVSCAGPARRTTRMADQQPGSGRARPGASLYGRCAFADRAVARERAAALIICSDVLG